MITEPLSTSAIFPSLDTAQGQASFAGFPLAWSSVLLATPHGDVWSAWAVARADFQNQRGIAPLLALTDRLRRIH
jgi:hypothetical protein